ncbi:SOS response-associated peptidase family protein [Novosphingobium terrae]|uniref:SOS response-associated peptidase family protein n=1 Tax=Novosphingobium terrae TaxID=2726189 RepID=UPI00389A65E4
MWFSVIDHPIFAVTGFWQATEEGNSFAIVTCDPNELVQPVHGKAMITILRLEHHDLWLRGGYDDVTALQQPYDAAVMSMRGPVFPTRNR